MNDVIEIAPGSIDHEHPNPLDEDMEKKRHAADDLHTAARNLDGTVRALAIALNSYAEAFNHGGHVRFNVSIEGAAIKELKIQFTAAFPENSWTSESNARGHNAMIAITEAIRRGKFDATEEVRMITVTR